MFLICGKCATQISCVSQQFLSSRCPFLPERKLSITSLTFSSYRWLLTSLTLLLVLLSLMLLSPLFAAHLTYNARPLSVFYNLNHLLAQTLLVQIHATLRQSHTCKFGFSLVLCKLVYFIILFQATMLLTCRSN